jgi:DNA modification methylase
MTLHVGDARDVRMLGLEPNSVRCTITSPPYWDLKEYAHGDDREIGRGQSKHDYLDAVRDVLSQVLELTADDGVMWLVADTMRSRQGRGGLSEIMPLPFELAEAAREVGWRFQDIIIWRKNKTLPYSGQGKLRNLTEYVLFFTRTGEFIHRPYRCADRHLPGAEWLAGWPERYHPLGRRPANIWDFDLDTQGMWDHATGRHACPFPSELVAQCIALTSDKGDVVLDPFAGVGTVVAQAAAMGRRGVGVELSSQNVAIYHETVLPRLQAKWEAESIVRDLDRADQLAEAELIMCLRLLKAGKEMLRAVQRLANARPVDHPAASVRTVVAIRDAGLGKVISVDDGKVSRAGGQLLLVSDLADFDDLRDDVNKILGEHTFTSLGIRLDARVITPTELDKHMRSCPLYEFGLSRHGAFTAPQEARLFEITPPLLTDIMLGSAISGDRETELDRARKRGERQLLTTELSAGHSLDTIAKRIGVRQAELHQLLLDHGLRDEPKSFAVPMPGQLTTTELGAG